MDNRQKGLMKNNINSYGAIGKSTAPFFVTSNLRKSKHNDGCDIESKRTVINRLR